MTTPVTIPDSQNSVFWFVFDFGLWSLFSLGLVSAAYFAAFVRMKVSSILAAVFNVGMLVVYMCAVFAIATVLRTLQVAHFEDPPAGMIGFGLGLIIPLVAHGLLHKGTFGRRAPHTREKNKHGE
jgi:hypothetical protein